MIRKRVGDEFWLIAQQDHAALAGAIAAAFGNRQFARPTADIVARATALHDSGWAAHDSAPTLDSAGLPADVFRMTRAIEHRAWLGSAEQAAAVDPYAGLLVALHQLSLSAYAAGAAANDRFDDEQRRRQFDLNKIQHALIEMAEQLRVRLGLPVDRPLRLGLAEGWTSPAEETLKFDFHVLQACDALSLHACCDGVPPSVVPQPQARPGSGTVTLMMTHSGIHGLRVRPWPLAETTLHAAVPFRAVQALTYDHVDRLRDAYAAASVREMRVEFRAG